MKPYIALLVAVIVFVSATVVEFLVRPSRRVVHTQTTVLVAPPRTRLRDSGPRNNPKHVKTSRSGKSTQRKLAVPAASQVSRPKVESTPLARKAPVPPRKHKTVVPKHKATPVPQKPSPPVQTSTAPAPPPPTAAVTTPVGTVTVCVKLLGC